MSKSRKGKKLRQPIKCYACGGFLPWQNWGRFWQSNMDVGNGGVLQRPANDYDELNEVTSFGAFGTKRACMPWPQAALASCEAISFCATCCVMFGKRVGKASPPRYVCRTEVDLRAYVAVAG